MGVKTWSCHTSPAAEDVHVVPDGDATAHLYADCHCGPATEPVQRDDGSMGWLVVHHSLDGRESTE